MKTRAMFDITQPDLDLTYLTHSDCPMPDFWHAPAERVSALLGPDGEPLRVSYPRPRMGFDLTPKAKP